MLRVVMRDGDSESVDAHLPAILRFLGHGLITPAQTFRQHLWGSAKIRNR